jgi:hypothetical protein
MAFVCDAGAVLGTNYSVLKISEGVRIELFGQLDEKAAKALDAEMGRLETPSDVRGVVFVTSGLSECVEAARLVLVELQKRLARRKARTAYVDERARFRGMALWVMHLAQDPNAKAVSSLDQAMRWLNAGEEREAHASKRVAL